MVSMIIKINKLLFLQDIPLSQRKHFFCSLTILEVFLLFKYWDLRHYRQGGIPIQSMESRKRMSFDSRQNIFLILLLLLFFMSCSEYSNLTTVYLKGTVLFLVRIIKKLFNSKEEKQRPLIKSSKFSYLIYL